MARSTPTLQGDFLVCREGEQLLSIRVGTPAWFTWLGTASSFVFVSTQGSYTAVKERRQRGGCYWRACRTWEGTTRRTYLGKTETLTMERLDKAAAEIFGFPTAKRWQAGEDDNRQETSFSGDPMAGQTDTSDPRRSQPSLGLEETDPLLVTKLRRPPYMPDMVARPHLKALLERGLQHKLTLISASAGFGKTTLLNCWSRGTKCPVAWMTADAGDNDPARYWSHVIAALRTLCLQVSDDVRALLRSSQSSPIESILAPLINALAAISDDLVLILDDYQAIESPAIHHGMAFLLDNLPPRVHLFIASRTDPPLPLARLRVKGDLLELRVADLSFTPEETNRFFNELVRLDLSHEEVDVLWKRTEGWIAALHLAALTLKQRDDTHGFITAFAGDHRHVFDYLMEEVFRLQPESVQTFLLQTSILERLNGPLCETMTGQGHGQWTLDGLGRANLFIVPLDDERHWYRYHHLFADALRIRLQWTSPELVQELHRRAGAWFVDHGFTREGLRHVLAAGDFNLAANLIEQIAQLMMQHSELVTIIDLVTALPDELVRARPRLCILHAYALDAVGQLDAAEARLQDVERYLERNDEAARAAYEVSSEPKVEELEDVRAAVIGSRAIIAGHRGDADLALALSHQYVAISPRNQAITRSLVLGTLGSAYLQSGDVTRANHALVEASLLGQTVGFVSHQIVSLSRLAGINVVEGRLHDAERTYRQALEIAEKAKSQAPVGPSVANVGLGWLMYEWNDLDGATRHITRGIELSKYENMIFAVLSGANALARVKHARGDTKGAFDVLQQAEDLASRNNHRHDLARLTAYKARLWLAEGNVDAAVRWAETSGLPGDSELRYEQHAGHMTLAQVMIAQNRQGEAIDLLDRLLEAAEQAGRWGSIIKILALRSVAQWAQGSMNSALTSLERALTIGEPEGYVRTFVDLGVPMRKMLTELGRRKTCGTKQSGPLLHTRRVLDAFASISCLTSGHRGDDETAEPNGEPLSEREIEVMRLIAAGWSTPKIAQEFVIAVSTVRTHVKNIYCKLNAHNRVEAVSCARNLRLL